MYLPQPYQTFTKNFPEVFESYQALGQACRKAGPLAGKTQELVKLGIAMGAGSRGGVMSAVRKALDAGASQEEIQHAILLAITTHGFPKMIVAMGWAEEVLSAKE
jgi:alkylhydroperoxidase/carboxymuconolactone decarboxylase family protein YurZ